MKQSNLLFLVGSLTILLIAGFAGILIWAAVKENDERPWPPKSKIEKSVAVEIKEVKVPVNVYIRDTVRVKIPCHKQHYETKTDTAE